MKRILSLLSVMCWATVLLAAKVDTVAVFSPSMQKNVKVVYIIPDKAMDQKAEKCPVLYLLHGYGGNEKAWIGVKPNLPQIADEKGMIFVCPDGKNSWYWDSPLNNSYRYETFVAKELVDYTDRHFNSRNDRGGRAITGLSMGGHGAMWIAMRHKDRFGAVGSTSGGVDIIPFPKKWEMSRQLGEYEKNKKRWFEHTVISQLDSIAPGDLAIIFDCGNSDFFLNVNKELHQMLLNRKIDHDFIVRPGTHNRDYWNNSIDYQILFFEKFFNKKK